jgi:lipopolysaccharide transport system ATP-binding protein
VAAHLDTDILLVDEVLAVGDINFRKKCMERMRAINTEAGRTILYVSHDMSSVRQICQRAIVISEGKIIKDGNAGDTTMFYEENALYGSESDAPTVIRKPIELPYYLSKVEIRNQDNNPCNRFETGQSMELHIWSAGEAPYDDFTIGFDLFSDRGEKLTYGTANPIQNVYFKKTDRHFVCTIGPLPLTTGKYFLKLSVGLWGMTRWDDWPDAVSFHITNCDPYKTGYNIHSSDFVLFVNQNWKALPHEYD